MPSVAKSYDWFVRVDGNHEFLKKQFETLNWVDIKRVIAFLHLGDTKENPHCHFVISLASELQKQSFDKRIKQHFNVQKKHEYSSKVWDGKDEAIAYMYHEDTEPVINRGFDQACMVKAKEHNKVVQKVISVNKEKASGKLLDKILEKVSGEDDLEQIAEVALDLIYEGSVYHPGDFKLKSVISDAYIKTRSKDEWKRIREATSRAFVSDIRKYLL